MRLETVLAGHAERRPEHTAVVCGSRRIGYAALQDSVRRAACGLHRLGVRPGDRVLLYLPNGVEFVQLAYAAFTLGAVAVPATTRLAAPEVAHIARDCRPAVAAYPAELREVIAKAGLPQCRALVLGDAQGGEVPLAEILATPATGLPALALGSGEAADDCMIQYTSGTTGRAKGAIVTHANMLVQCVYMHAVEWGLDRDDRFLVTTPLAHRTGCSRMFNALGLGGTLVVMEKFDPARAVELIERERVTVAGLVPTVIRMLLPHIRENPRRCDSLRRLIVAAEAFPVALKREIIALLPQAQIFSLFGLTEAQVTSLSPAEQFAHPESVGRAIPGIEIRLVDDAGRDVAAGEVGELLVRAGIPGRSAVFRGYFDRPEDTAACLQDGWFRTGDLACADAGGYYSIVDRKKDMVLSGGFNIYSKEVEQALASHPDIADAAVIGVPDETFGEAVAAFVETRPGARLGAEAVIEHCRALLAGYKKPRHVFFVEALPRNSVGKVLKNRLREMADKDALDQRI